MPNRLQNEKSEYLLQHKDNPVDWFPWGKEAFEISKKEDKPIFLSIGYSACHWCHVMEEESFEDQETADFLNKNFVSIKVDREERPDVDSVYMTSVQIIAGHGGWPMSSFLTPEGKPFFAGTYFPKEGRHGLPSFMEVLKKIALLYGTKRADIEKSSNEITHVLKKQFEGNNEEIENNESTARLYVKNNLENDFDSINKGFGKAPKFPQPILHEFILEHYSKTKDKDFLKISLETLDAIEKGGIHDQVGGGFHRYSVDEKWLVPHFEKMLYDNTSLAYLYLNAYRITKKEKYKNTVEKTLNYLSKEMLSESGGFYSAQDADSEGVEGKFFTWSINEINSVLNKEEVKSIISNFNLTHEGNFEGKNIFYKNEDIKEKDKKVISEALKKLYKERSKRIPPLTDRKVITSWNSMALKVFAKAGVIFGNKKWIEIAEKNANYLLKNNILNNKIQRASYENAPSNIHGQLEDYSFLIQALVELNESTGENIWIEKAISFTDKMIDEFWSEKEGKFYDSGKSSTDTLVRPSTTQDNITASGISVACEILIKLGVITNDNNYIEIVEKQLKNASNDIGRYPAAHCNWLKFLNIDNYSSQIVFTGKNFMSLLKTVNSEFLPSLTYGFDKGEKSFYISKDKYLDGKNLAYFCKDYHCELPVESDEELLNQIRN